MEEAPGGIARRRRSACPPATGLPFALDPTLLRRGQFVADLIYAPATTPLLAAAAAAGRATANGLGP